MNLPPQVGDFKLVKEFRPLSDQGADSDYLIFTYENEKNGWTVKATLNAATEEFFIRTDIGMLEFALVEFITEDFAIFRRNVEGRLPALIRDYYVERQNNFSVLLMNKGITTVAWDDVLPEQYKGLQRTVSPNDAVRIINGSYMILAYYDRQTRSGLSLMYNILRDDFFAERRIHNFPNLVHDFDSSDVRVLHDSLKKRLVPVLDAIVADMAEPE